VWKLAIGNNSNDNFSLGKYGNLVAQVDIKSGCVSCAVDGLWPHARQHARHPITGNLFRDFSIPYWDLVISDTLKATSIIPAMKIQHWDIAIGENGPIFIELNDIGAIAFLQLQGIGLLDKTLVDLLRESGNLRDKPALKKFVRMYK
jgi:hypothetical protein